MPRRIWTYLHGGLWESNNLISSIGSWIDAPRNARLRREHHRTQDSRVSASAPNDPWLGDTLEWYTTSPPPPENFDPFPYVDERAAAA